MIRPEEIRRKAENQYRAFLCAWLDRDDSFFPKLIPANRELNSTDIAAAIEAVRVLREGSKGVRGFGYSVEWEERRSRQLGRNMFPKRIAFETQEDFLRFIGRQSEFTVFVDAVQRLRAEFPKLENWHRLHRQELIDSATELDGLLSVLRCFHAHPLPNCFARELPLPVDTKFIERHKRILFEWFDITLPPHAIRSYETQFERRFGLRYAEPHLLVRLLDPAFQVELKFPCMELSLPLGALSQLPVSQARVLIVENKVNLLTLPPLPRTIALGGLGGAVTLLRDVGWLNSIPLIYWGDVDVDGLNILASLRALFPQTHSLFMDEATLDRFSALTTSGNGRDIEPPPLLTNVEAQAFLRCHSGNLRLEQERIPHSALLQKLQEESSLPESKL